MHTLYFDDPVASRRDVPLGLIALDGVSPATAETGGQPLLWTPSGGEENTSGVLVAVKGAWGLYKVALSQAQLQLAYPGEVARVYFKSSSCLVGETLCMIEPPTYLYVGAITDGTSNSVLLPSGTKPAKLDPGSVVYLLTGAGTPASPGVLLTYTYSTGLVVMDGDWPVAPNDTTVVAIVAGPMPAPELQARVVAIGTSSGASDAAESLGDAAQAIARGAVSSTPSSATTIATDLTAATADFYKGKSMYFISGPATDQSHVIVTSSTAGVMIFDAADAWTVLPAAGDRFVLT